MTISNLLLEAFSYSMDAPFAVTDIVLREGKPIVLKGAGNMLCPAAERIIDRAEMDEMLQVICSDYVQIIAQHGQLEMRYEVDLDSSEALGETSTKTLRVTGLTFDGGSRLSTIIRINSDKAWPISDLKLPELAENAIRELKPGGLLLVAGPMAAGKSTTMYAAVNLLNSLTPQTIVTIEDPIETRLDSGAGLIIQREVSAYGRDHSQRNYRHSEDSDGNVRQRLPMGDVPDFITGVRGAMRQSLNGMLIMEIRDSETADAALRAAEAGLWVIAGIHSSESVGALDRLINFAPADQRVDRARLLSRRLHAVLFQKLVPDVQKKQSVLAVEVLYPKASSEPKDVQKFAESFKDNNLAALQAILNKSAESETSSPDVLALNRSLLNLVREGQITKEAAFSASYDLHGLKHLFSQNL